MEISTVETSNYDELSLFLSQFSGETERLDFWLARFRFWWDKNPACSKELKRGWFLRKNKRIVGFIGNIPLFLQLHGKKAISYAATTWRVLPEYRQQSILLFYKWVGTFSYAPLFCTTPNENVVKVLKSLRFQSFPGKYQQVSFIVINAKEVLETKLKKNAFLSLCSKGIRAGSILNWIQSLQLKNLEKSAWKQVHRLQKADSSFNQLWERTRDRVLTTNIRTADHINWYCFENESHRKELFGYYKNGLLLGYIICWGRIIKRLQLRVMECVDLWIDPQGNGIAESLIHSVMVYAQENSFDIVIFPHFTIHAGKILRKAGLFEMTVPEVQRFFKICPGPAQDINAANSYFVGHQGDYGM